jgi:aconitate hydratase
VRAVIAQSYERIHRSNLIGMGVLPLQLGDGVSLEALGLTGREQFDIGGIADGLGVGARVTVRAKGASGAETPFTAIARLDTPVEVEYYRNGGILHYVLRQLAR